MPISSTGAFALLLALQGATPANDAKRLGKDDYEFARALSDRGWGDLADMILGAIERQQGSGGEDALRTSVIRFDLQTAQAYKAAQAAQRAKLLSEVVTAKE